MAHQARRPALSHLCDARAELYRDVLAIVTEHGPDSGMRTEQIHRHLASPLPLGELRDALDQLVEWGNLRVTVNPTAREAVSLTGTHEPVRVYSVTVEGRAAQAALIAYEAAISGHRESGVGQQSAGGTEHARHQRLELHPFVATRYRDPQLLSSLTSPAYDLIEPSEREMLAQSDEHSIVHLTLPTFGAEDAKRRLIDWRREGVLCTDAGPSLFVYDLAEIGAESEHLSTRGWVGSVSLVPPGSPAISPHEATMPGPVADRLRLLAATRANLEPIVLTHDGTPGAAHDIANGHVSGNKPMIDLVDGAGVRHRLWRVTDAAQVASVQADFADRRAVIADGHHRYESYLGYQARQHAVAPGSGPWDRGLALLVPSETHGPEVRAIHRVVPDLALGHAAQAAAVAFRVMPAGAMSPGQADDLLRNATQTTVLLTDGRDWVTLTDPQRPRLLATTPSALADAWRDLDIALVDAGLIGDLWAASATVTLRHSIASAIATAQSTAGVAVLVRPTTASTVLRVAARGVLMPRKSTFFVPKPRTGLVLRCFVDEPDYPREGAG